MMVACDEAHQLERKCLCEDGTSLLRQLFGGKYISKKVFLKNGCQRDIPIIVNRRLKTE